MAIEGDKIFFEFDPFELAGVDGNIKNKREARQRIADLVLEEVLDYVGQAKSPVAGEAWKASLSKKYKEFKSDISGSTKANMELYGDMLDALECVVNRGGNLELRIKGRESAKADGHNNHSGDSSLPQRRFIPDDGQTFRRDIIAKIRDIASEYVDDQATDGGE